MCKRLVKVMATLRCNICDIRRARESWFTVMCSKLQYWINFILFKCIHVTRSGSKFKANPEHKTRNQEHTKHHILLCAKLYKELSSLFDIWIECIPCAARTDLGNSNFGCKYLLARIIRYETVHQIKTIIGWTITYNQKRDAVVEIKTKDALLF